jgi:Hemingway/CFA97
LFSERYAQIEHENRLLLSKMSDIVAGKSAVESKTASGEYGHSLNREYRRRELQRITEENLVC